MDIDKKTMRRKKQQQHGWMDGQEYISEIQKIFQLGFVYFFFIYPSL